MFCFVYHNVSAASSLLHCHLLMDHVRQFAELRGFVSINPDEFNACDCMQVYITSISEDVQ